MQPETAHQTDETNKTKIVINPLSPFLKKYPSLEIHLPRHFPHCVTGIVSLAVIDGTSSILMAWIKATWISYVSVDTTLIIFGLLLLWREKIQHYEFEDKESSP